jgi:hypothetical protein
MDMKSDNHDDNEMGLEQFSKQQSGFMASVDF